MILSETINQYDLWYNPEVKVIKAKQFIGTPNFYPVYRYNNYYSWSLIELIKHIGSVNLNNKVKTLTESKNFTYLPDGVLPIDGIIRLGGAMQKKSNCYRSPNDFAVAIAKSLILDINEVETKLSGFTNIILVGGKDSLNLTLLPWKNPVIVASAAPNASLVKEFMSRNALSHKFIELRNDDDDSLLSEEILSNCTRIDLRHMRWQKQCRDIGEALAGKAVFWSGSLGDTFLTPYWRNYRDLTPFPQLILLASLAKWHIQNWLLTSRLQQRYFDVAWTRGAMWQAISLAIHRDVTKCLCLSGYHGERVSKTLQKSSLFECVNEDIRPMIGTAISGREIIYPSENPSPPPTHRPLKVNHFDHWVAKAKEAGLSLRQKAV